MACEEVIKELQANASEKYKANVVKMEVLEDVESKEMIWREGDTMYYPGGVTDPDYCVLKFTASKGRYYANFKSESFIINS